MIHPEATVDECMLEISALEAKTERLEERLEELLAGKKLAWQPMETAPKDGTTIIVPLAGAVRVYWDNELKTWVLNHPLHMESIRDPIGWRAEGASS